jgi:flagellar assembly factor FliW
VTVKTGRFGQLSVGNDEIIHIPHGVMGFPEQKTFCLVDPGDETLILWLQSTQDPDIAFPVLEPKIFKPDYAVRLSAAELRELKLENINQSAVFAILTIPEDATQMTANLKAPLVINLQQHLARQVVLQETEYNIRHEMFKELKAHLLTIASQKQASKKGTDLTASASTINAVAIKNIPPSLTVRTLQA